MPGTGEAARASSQLVHEDAPGIIVEPPRRFDTARSRNRHLAFGAGAHQCLGLHLARLEMRILFETLLDRIESVELVGEPARSKSTFVGGLKTLPLKITPT